MDAKKGVPEHAVIQVEQATTSGPQPPQQYGFWQLEYYQKYFDIDTLELFAKTKNHALFQFSAAENLLTEKMDLYGPFWIPTTVIFLTFIMSSISGSIYAYMNGKAFEYDFKVLSWSVAIIYSYLGLVPLCLFLLGRYFGEPSSTLIFSVSVYGYGQIVWIPGIIFLSFFHSTLIKLIIAGVCGAHGALLRLRLIKLKSKMAKLIVILAAEVAYSFAMFFFFKDADITNPAAPVPGNGNTTTPSSSS